ncbi:MAG: BACON domain-containing protein [Bryobacteraceae bacterium]
MVALLLLTGLAQAIDCSKLPTQFTGSEYPSGDFFTNFLNACYTIPLAPSGLSKSDLNDTFWPFHYKVNPRYQLIIVGNFPNARFFSVSAYDDHYQLSQAILDTSIVPLTSAYVNPYLAGAPYSPGQMYAVPLGFEGTPGTEETGCQMNGYNVGVNALDGALRHQGMNWNTDPGVFEQYPTQPSHVVDTPQHTNPPKAGYVMIRAYVDATADDPQAAPSVIVRDVATGCAYPAAYALNTLQAISLNSQSNWMDQAQLNAHNLYDNNYLPWLCYATDPRGQVIFQRDGQAIKLPDSFGTYTRADFPNNLPATLAAAGEVMRVRLRVPIVPPTPCTNGCSRSGNEQVRYMGLSFDTTTGATLASIGDYQLTQDANGYATLIVGTGAAIPAWVTPANGYTFLDMTQASGYQTLSNVQIRNILNSATFACSSSNVPFKTTPWTPQGSMMGDYLPVIDYPLASSLPLVTSELIGPSACGTLPVGVPAVSPSCGVLPSNPMSISPAIAPVPGEATVSVQPSPPIDIEGSGFGFLPGGQPFTGDSSYLQIADLTQNWTAGFTNSPCSVTIAKWDDNRIEAVPNVNQNGQCPLVAGDQLGVAVWNPQTGGGPITAGVSISTPVVSAFSLATTSALVGSAAGTGSVEINAVGPWTVSTNSGWLGLPSLSGVGNSFVEYTYVANSNANPRTGTLTIAGLTFTVTQAGATYQPATQMMPLVTSGLSAPQGVAVDGQGNVYIADTGNNAVREWFPGTQQVNALLTSGLNGPAGVAVDGSGNVYIADGGNRAIEEWSLANQQLTTLAGGLGDPDGVAFSAGGILYFTDTGTNVIDQWSPSNPGSIGVTASGLSGPTGVAVDFLGNVYFSNTGANTIELWSPGNQQISTLVESGLNGPSGVAVDAQGNVYFADTGNNAIKQWNYATHAVAMLVSSGLNSPTGIAVDSQDNVYVADTNNNAIKKYSFVYLSLSSTNMNEGAQAGTNSVSYQVVPANTPVTAISSQPWLTITGVSNGVIGYAFQANVTGVTQTAYITVLGQQITVTQDTDTAAKLIKTAGDTQTANTGQLFATQLQVTVTDGSGVPFENVPVVFSILPSASGASGTWSSLLPVLTNQLGVAIAPLLTANGTAGKFKVTASIDQLSVTFNLTNVTYALAMSSVTVGSGAGMGNVFLSASASWTATSNAAWLTVAPGSTSGSGNALVTFSYGANFSPSAQTGTLTIAGLTFTVTQAGTSYTQVFPMTTLVSSGVSLPQGVAVDALGDVYIADTGNNAVEKWVAGTQQFTPVVTSGLINPTAVALDAQGNLYIADNQDFAIKEWSLKQRDFIPLVAVLINPYGVAVDPQGNVYFTDAGANMVEEWTASNKQVSTLVGGAGGPLGVAVDRLGNVYFASAANDDIMQWNPATQQLTTLVPSAGIIQPAGVAVDGQGNIYFSDTGANAVRQWNTANQQLVTVASAGLSSPAGVAVDTQGNVYVADQNNNAIREFTPAYVALGTAALNEGPLAGSDSFGAQVLPVSVPLTATSNQPWLSITSTAGGIVTYSFQNNISIASRVAQINVLGLIVTVTQAGDAAANISITAGNNQTTPVGQPFATPLEVNVTDSNGIPVEGAAVTFTVTPGSSGAGATWNLAPPQPILTDQNGNATAPVLTANNLGGPFTVTASAGSVNTTFNLNNEFIALGAYTLNVASAAGNGQVLLVAAGPWTAVSNASWLTVNPATASGTGNGTVLFSYAANLSPTPQTGTLTISGQVLTVTQAGAGFLPGSQVTPLVSSGLSGPQGVAVDGQGNVYIADTSNNAIEEWNASTQQVSTLVSGLNAPTGVAVDSSGNVYFTDNKNNAIKEWSPSTQQVSVLVSSGINGPSGVAVDGQGNVYFSDSNHNFIKEWVAATKTVTKLVSAGLNLPRGVAVDSLGNVYLADTKNNALKEWNATSTLVTSLVSSGLNNPFGVAVDGQGNSYVADMGDNAIKQWNVAGQQLVPLVSTGLQLPHGVAVDSQGNIYIADTNNNAIKKLSFAYLLFGSTNLNESYKAGADSVTVQVVPANTPWTATSSTKWLTITGTANGTIGFSFTSNSSTSSRSATITVLGQHVTVTQSGK